MSWATPGQLGYRWGDITVALRNGTTDQPEHILSDAGKMHVLPYLWNPNTLQFEVSTASNVSGSVSVSNFPAVQPVSATALPLPAGAATETTLAKIPGMSIPVHDYMGLSQDATHDVWTYKVGGSGGTTVATLTITFTDATKAVISSIAKT
jgi:hypothetical protein